MEFTKEQRLIALMLAEVHQALGIKTGVDSAFVREAINSGNDWAISFEMYGVDEQLPPRHVKEVIDTLSMWSGIEQAYAELDDLEKERFSAEAFPYGEPKWPGFDGNNEAKHLSAARMLINHMDRFGNFADRGDLNSHSATLETTRRMLEVYDSIYDRMANSGNFFFTLEDLIALFKARIHPSQRTNA